MSLKTGCLSGIYRDPLLGLDACGFAMGPSGPALLADLNFSAPVTSWKTGYTGFSSPNATDEWLMQDASSPMTNNVGSETLANDTGLVGQICPVIYDGTAYGNRKVWESDDAALNADSLVSSGVTAGDADSMDFCFRFVFRNHIPFVLNDTLLAKREGAPYLGWGIYGNSLDKIHFLVDDGPTSVQIATSTGGFSDGALHYVTGWYDYSANIIYIKSDISAEASTSTAAVTGSLANTAPLCINTRTDNTLTEGAPGMQVAYVGVCVGANAQAMYDEDFWQHAGDPTGLLTTQTRASLISVPLSASTVGHFTDNTLPIGYHSAFSDTNKLGLYCNTAVTNLCPKSENVAGWNTSLCTVANNVADSPDGFRSAGSMTATSNDGLAYVPNLVISALTTYTTSVWLKRNGGSDVSGFLEFTEYSPTITSTQAYTATNTWQRVMLTRTTATGVTGGQLRVKVSTSGESVLIWGAQVELGDGAGAYIRTGAAPASLAYSNYITVGSAGQYIKAATGEIEATWIPRNVNSGGVHGYILSAADTGNVNRRYIVSANNASAISVGSAAWDSSSVLQENLTCTSLPTSITEIVHSSKWDASGGLSLGGGEDAILSYNSGTGQVTDVGSYTATETLTTLNIGQYSTGSSQLNGYIQRVRVWDGER